MTWPRAGRAQHERPHRQHRQDHLCRGGARPGRRASPAGPDGAWLLSLLRRGAGARAAVLQCGLPRRLRQGAGG